MDLDVIDEFSDPSSIRISSIPPLQHSTQYNIIQSISGPWNHYSFNNIHTLQLHSAGEDNDGVISDVSSNLPLPLSNIQSIQQPSPIISHGNNSHVEPFILHAPTHTTNDKPSFVLHTTTGDQIIDFDSRITCHVCGAGSTDTNVLYTCSQCNILSYHCGCTTALNNIRSSIDQSFICKTCELITRHNELNAQNRINNDHITHQLLNQLFGQINTGSGTDTSCYTLSSTNRNADSGTNTDDCRYHTTSNNNNDYNKNNKLQYNECVLSSSDSSEGGTPHLGEFITVHNKSYTVAPHFVQSLVQSLPPKHRIQLQRERNLSQHNKVYNQSKSTSIHSNNPKQPLSRQQYSSRPFSFSGVSADSSSSNTDVAADIDTSSDSNIKYRTVKLKYAASRVRQPQNSGDPLHNIHYRNNQSTNNDNGLKSDNTSARTVNESPEQTNITDTEQFIPLSQTVYNIQQSPSTVQHDGILSSISHAELVQPNYKRLRKSVTFDDDNNQLPVDSNNIITDSQLVVPTIEQTVERVNSLDIDQHMDYDCISDDAQPIHLHRLHKLIDDGERNSTVDQLIHHKQSAGIDCSHNVGDKDTLQPPNFTRSIYKQHESIVINNGAINNNHHVLQPHKQPSTDTESLSVVLDELPYSIILNVYRTDQFVSNTTNKHKQHNNDNINHKPTIETKLMDTLPLRLVYENLSTTYKNMTDYIRLYV